MTKQELMETYTAEQLAEMVVELDKLVNMSKNTDSLIKTGLFKNPTDAAIDSEIKIMQYENDFLQSEVEKYRKAFDDAKNECDCQIEEYQKKIEELGDEKESLEMRLKLLKKDRDDLREEVEKLKKIQDFSDLTPIEVVNALINAGGEYEHNPLTKAFYGTDKGTYRIFNIGELRQIAEHLLVYCNHNGEVEE